MPRRYQPLNIPIEIVRTVVAISETGSLTKAAEKLGLSQPAVSSQIKRIQSMVGGALFARTANGTTATQLGKLVLHQARRILEANDQMLRLGGAAHLPQPVRLGLSTLFVREFLGHQTAQSLTDVVIQTDNSVGITKGLIDGYIDIAYILENPEMTSEIAHLIVNDTDEEFVWVRSRDFVLSPDSPIPILTWPGDDLMIRTLTRQGIAYKVVFNSPDYHAKLAAVEAGIGIAAIPRRLIPPSLVWAQEYYLPELPPIKALLCARSNLESSQGRKLLEDIATLFFKAQVPTLI
ncbi:MULTISPECIES: LysR family transcriptional regulator [unclassified Tardiphaga]|uniref:LysR family transcriptional regulator n=1 Tax=unclassified Tardiphaga TaxID=2631404 RepID=UPI001FF04DCC|nr:MULTISPECIES: LysR family transcriptional regulator [unclassified Tardiphaga]